QWMQLTPKTSLENGVYRKRMDARCVLCVHPLISQVNSPSDPGTPRSGCVHSLRKRSGSRRFKADTEKAAEAAGSLVGEAPPWSSGPNPLREGVYARQSARSVAF